MSRKSSSVEKVRQKASSSKDFILMYIYIIGERDQRKWIHDKYNQEDSEGEKGKSRSNSRRR
jgi:hypothetical protein